MTLQRGSPGKLKLISLIQQCITDKNRKEEVFLYYNIHDYDIYRHFFAVTYLDK